MIAVGSKEHRARLQPILDQLKAADESVFLDLCELVLMLAESVDGSIKFSHERVMVHIEQRPRVAKVSASKREARELELSELPGGYIEDKWGPAVHYCAGGQYIFPNCAGCQKRSKTP